ncbi:unnamed protein product [Rodentolepis nana]|uniref:BHLH domain-containing protein n=1 Tax=Rodentolepis nana TaxID=102285 RepID=A0A0R3TH58_RODNA|nr:unnamed protein product [Rodentolepis nana]
MYGNTQPNQTYLPSGPTTNGFQQFPPQLQSVKVDNSIDLSDEDIIHQSGKRMKHDRSRAADFSKAFDRLRGMIPTHPRDRRLSKSEILRLATSYIRHLNTVLATGIPPSQHPCMKPSNSSNFTDDKSRICTFCINDPLNGYSKIRKEV